MKKQVSIGEVLSNPKNPRVIKDSKFIKLVNSIKEFPEMLEKRSIVVDESMMVLGGNMRLKACKEAGLKKVWVDVAEGWTDKQKKEFIIKDNVGFGEWDWDLLANEWETNELSDWGVDSFEFSDKDYNDQEVDLDDFKDEQVLKLNFNQEEYLFVKESLSKLDANLEIALLKLLNYGKV